MEERKINVYDFDKTIYKGDSTLDFFRYCIIKKPTIIKMFPKIFTYTIYFIMGKCDKTKFKEIFYGFVKEIDEIDCTVKMFWIKHKSKIEDWYLLQKSETDVIISASPYFLLEPICKELKISNLIASEVDFKTGKCLSQNCHGTEKVNRFYEKYPQGIINNFYSDSLSDLPLARIAKNSFLVNKGILNEWKI